MECYRAAGNTQQWLRRVAQVYPRQEGDLGRPESILHSRDRGCVFILGLFIFR